MRRSVEISIRQFVVPSSVLAAGIQPEVPFGRTGSSTRSQSCPSLPVRSASTRRLTGPPLQLPKSDWRVDQPSAHGGAEGRHRRHEACRPGRVASGGPGNEASVPGCPPESGARQTAVSAGESEFDSCPAPARYPVTPPGFCFATAAST